MADVSDFALAAFTGVAVMSFYQPKEWDRYQRKGVVGLGVIALLAWLLGVALGQSGNTREAREWGRLFNEIGLWTLGLLIWSGVLHWLTGRDEH